MLSSTDMSQKVPTINRVDKASATKTIDLGSIRGRIKPKTKKIHIYSFLAWRSTWNGTAQSLVQSVVDRWQCKVWWTGGSLTRRPQGLFAVSWPRHIGEQRSKRNYQTTIYQSSQTCVFFVNIRSLSQCITTVRAYETVSVEEHSLGSSTLENMDTLVAEITLIAGSWNLRQLEEEQFELKIQPERRGDFSLEKLHSRIYVRNWDNQNFLVIKNFTVFIFLFLFYSNLFYFVPFKTMNKVSWTHINPIYLNLGFACWST